jgi:hypothetical protein
MCKLRTLIIDKNGKILKDSVIDVGKVTLSVIDAPAMCIYVNKNDNGYDNFLFKYSNVIEEQVVINTDSNNTIMTIGRKSGCIYAYQFKQEIGLSELIEIRGAALMVNNGVRYQTNIKSLSNLIEHVYAKIKDAFKKNEM